MSRVKKGGLIVSIFSLAVAVATLICGIHTQRVHQAESFKKVEAMNLELNSVKGTWVIEVAQDCKKAGCNKDKQIFETDLRIDQTRRLTGETYLIETVTAGVEKDYDKTATADHSVAGIKNGEDVFLKLSPFGSSAGAEEFDLTGLMFRDDCITGNYFKSDKTFGKFVGFRTTGTLAQSDISTSLDQCVNIN